MTRVDDACVHLGDANHGGVEVVDLEPQEHAIAVGLVVAVADGAVVVIIVEVVELEDQRVPRHQSLVLRSTVSAAAPEKLSIPPTARLDVSDGNEWLGAHQTLHLQLELTCRSHDTRAEYSRERRVWHHRPLRICSAVSALQLAQVADTTTGRRPS